MKAFLPPRITALACIFSFIVMVLLLPSCNKKETTDIIPQGNTFDTAYYNVIKTGFNYPPQSPPWDTVYGQRTVEVITGDSTAFFREIESSFSFSAAFSPVGTNYFQGECYGDPTFHYLVFYNGGDSLRVFSGFIHTSGSEGTYWTGKKVQ